MIGIVAGAGALIHGAACIGHGRCALECPVDAIKLVMGSSERGVELPAVDAGFETNRRGVFVIGELGGMGLIRNAMRQGLQAGGALATELGPTPAPNRGAATTVDVAIIGAGPAGIAAAVPLAQAGLRTVLLERERFGGTIASFPAARS